MIKIATMTTMIFSPTSMSASCLPGVGSRQFHQPSKSPMKHPYENVPATRLRTCMTPVSTPAFAPTLIRSAPPADGQPLFPIAVQTG